MYNWMKNKITDLYNAVSAPVAATRDALSERLQSVRDTVTLLYERAKQKLGYGQPLKDIVEEQANQDYIGIEDIKHLYPRAKTQTTDNGIQGIIIIIIISLFNVDKKKEVKIQLKSLNLQDIKLPKR